ncbi:hypothetical protein IR133_01735 [Staphylococcus saprophyticus]|uniref:hypothetical protein n=1 Tax=Staphylococcus xylosus TaxID=1288 RepID=UPI000349A41D|nr:hypothetical protein [Staphylococcus xylosus]MBF0812424.1 hypothetical protein [Staphylococcus saprophyticus]TFV25379.1 hypothetical protein E4T75_01735 [Staphylococcus saprophyticus]
MNFIFFIGILVFSCFWTWLTNKFLPAETLDKNKSQSRYDERQSKMFIEILAKSFIWLIYSLLFLLLLRVFGWFDVEGALISTYPEIIFILIGLFLLVFNYFMTKKKYT